MSGSVVLPVTVEGERSSPAVLGWALAYASRGMHVFPLRPRSKFPLTRHGFKDATTETEQIVQWWTDHPDSNVGIATGAVSNLAVLDVDGPDAEGRLAELSLVSDDPSWQDAWISVTGRPGGSHSWFNMSDDVPRSGAARLGAGLDVKANDAYIVAPPSVHPNGSVYSFVGKHRKRQPWPAWLVPAEKESLRATESVPNSRPGTRGGRNQYAAAALANEVEAVRTASVGTRNDTLNTAAFAVARFALSGDLNAADVVTTLVDAAVAVGLPEAEARRTVASAFSARRSA